MGQAKNRGTEKERTERAIQNLCLGPVFKSENSETVVLSNSKISPKSLEFVEKASKRYPGQELAAYVIDGEVLLIACMNPKELCYNSDICCITPTLQHEFYEELIKAIKGEKSEKILFINVA